MEATVISEEVLANYIRLWGKPSGERHFRLEGFHIVVYKWDISTNPRGADTYASVGLSEYSMPEHHDTHRYELFVDLIPGKDEIMETLADICVIPCKDEQPIGNTHSVTFGWPLWPDAKMRSVFLTEADPDDIAMFEDEDGLHVEFLHVIPLYPSELQFKKEHSLDALLKHWYEHDVHYEDPNRPPEPA